MTAFATADDLATRLGVTFTDDEETRATALLTTASGLIQEEAKQIISLVTDDTFTIPGTRDAQITLPERPVISVASVTVNGTTLAQGTDWYLDGSTINRLPWFATTVVPGEGNADLLRRGFGWPAQTIAIVYTHGYDTIPESIKAICLESCVRVWINPGSVIRESYGSEDVYYVGMSTLPSGPFLTAAEQRIIRRKFGRHVASITTGS